jgi:DNA repair photolyase
MQEQEALYNSDLSEGLNMENETRSHQYPLKTGITKTPEFAKKKLADYALNPEIRCGHKCLYSSTKSMLRTHRAFKDLKETPFDFGFAIVDSTTPERVARDAARIRKPGLVQLCTIVDAWAPEAQEHDLGRRCMEAVLSHSDWTVRILTKNASVSKDFDLVEQHKNRVLVGLTITGTPDQDEVINILEPNASSIQERMSVMVEAAARGFRTYGMFCPLLPGIADAPEQIDQLVKFAVDCRMEEIFAEPVNPRGPGLRLCQEALEQWGYDKQAHAIAQIRSRKHWSEYVVQLIRNIQASVRKYSTISKLRFLLYPQNLLPEHKTAIQKDNEGVVWL